MIALERVVPVKNGSCFFVNLSICSKKTGGRLVRLDQVHFRDVADGDVMEFQGCIIVKSITIDFVSQLSRQVEECRVMWLCRRNRLLNGIMAFEYTAPRC